MSAAGTFRDTPSYQYRLNGTLSTTGTVVAPFFPGVQGEPKRDGGFAGGLVFRYPPQQITPSGLIRKRGRGLGRDLQYI